MKQNNGGKARSGRAILMAGMAAVAVLGLAACEKKGPLERAGEKVDHGIDTLKNGGKEPASDKLEDAGNKMRDAASDAKDAATGK